MQLRHDTEAKACILPVECHRAVSHGMSVKVVLSDVVAFWPLSV